MKLTKHKTLKDCYEIVQNDGVSKVLLDTKELKELRLLIEKLKEN